MCQRMLPCQVQGVWTTQAERDKVLQGALDATGACCDGVVDNFGVCNGYDASGVFQVALAEGASIATLASSLGLSSSKVTPASE